MKLLDYMSLKGLNHRAMAELLGVDRSVVTRYVSGIYMPSPRSMKKIMEVTDGAVTPNDFFRNEQAGAA